MLEITKSFENTEKQSGSAAARKTYSAMAPFEVGNLMNTDPRVLFDIELGRQTDWYTNIDYMEEMIASVNDVERIDGLIKILLTMQEYQVSVEHHPQVCYRVTDERKFAPFVPDLATVLDAIRTRVLHSREVQRQLDELKMEWSPTSSGSGEDYKSQGDSCNNTPPSTFNDSTITDIPLYKMSDLPYNLKDYLAITDDKIYSEFVDILKNEIWPWIQKMNRGKGLIKKWNAVKFISLLRGIIRRGRDSVQDFTEFLNHIFKGEQEFKENTITQYSAANDDKNYKGYDLVPYKCDSTLKQDGQEIEKMLSPIIKAMNPNKEEEIRQAS